MTLSILTISGFLLRTLWIVLNRLMQRWFLYRLFLDTLMHAAQSGHFCANFNFHLFNTKVVRLGTYFSCSASLKDCIVLTPEDFSHWLGLQGYDKYATYRLSIFQTKVWEQSYQQQLSASTYLKLYPLHRYPPWAIPSPQALFLVFELRLSRNCVGLNHWSHSSPGNILLRILGNRDS